MAKATKVTKRKAKRHARAPAKFTLPLRVSLPCPIELLDLDAGNPRLQTGTDLVLKTDADIITALSDIAALDELILSIATNKYLNLEPLIVIAGKPGRFRVLEGNRRLAAIRLIRNRPLANELGIRLPERISEAVLKSTEKVLAYRVEREEEAQAFIGFKHINGPQRWDAYAKARFVASWYRRLNGRISIESIAAQLGDNNQTLRDYLNSILVLEQAEANDLWKIGDRTAHGRFAFSHLYTALGRKEYQAFLGLPEGWSSKPSTEPISKGNLPKLKEVLMFIYGSKSEDKPALVRSQNPDLKNLGTVLVHREALERIRNGASLELALDTTKETAVAFKDALIAVNLRMNRAVELMQGYRGGDQSIDSLVEVIYDQADTLRTMTEKKKRQRH